MPQRPNARTGSDPRTPGGPPSAEIVPLDLLVKILGLVPERLRRKVDLALKRNTRVMLANNPETHVLLDVAKQFDKAKCVIRDGAGTDRHDGPDSIRRFRAAVIDLDEAVSSVCAAAGLSYISPLSVASNRVLIGGPAADRPRAALPTGLPQAAGRPLPGWLETMQNGVRDERMKGVYKAAVKVVVIDESIRDLLRHASAETRKIIEDALKGLAEAVTLAAEED